MAYGVDTLNQFWALGPLVIWVVGWRCLVRNGRTGPEAVLLATMLWAGLVWGLSNGLSLAGFLTPLGLRVVWTLLAVLGLGVAWRWPNREKCVWPGRWSRFERVLLVGALVLIGLVLVRAIVAPPNTVDVLNYHLPRQVRWLQEGSLAPYETMNVRETIMPPLAEVIGLQFLGLTGGDDWANLPQAFSYVGLALAVALLARRLGAGRRAALVAGVLALLLPMANHEASGAKNDLMGAFWIVLVALAVEEIRRTLPGGRPVGGARLGLAVMLAWLTKSTAMLFVPPVIVAGLAGSLCGEYRKTIVKTVGLALAIWLIGVTPFHARVLNATGSLLGEHRAEDGGGQMNEAMSPALLGSSVLRQATLHLLGPNEACNAIWLGVVQRYHRLAGLDVNDRRVTLWTMEFNPRYAPRLETIAGAPVQFLLITVAGCVVIFGGGGRRAREVRWLVWSVAAGALLFCLLLKWQPWAARLHLPLFGLGLVPLTVILSGGHKGFTTAGAASLAALSLTIAGWLPGADTEGRSLWNAPTLWRQSREAGYYAKLPERERRDADLARVIKEADCREVLILNLHDITYPLMRKLREQQPLIRFTSAWNETDAPDAIVVLRMGENLPLYHELKTHARWRLVGAGYGEGVYLPEAKVRELGWWERLPDFAGWTIIRGLSVIELRAGDGPSEFGRELSSRGAELSYQGEGQVMRLSMEVLRLGGGPVPVNLFLGLGDSEPVRIEVAQAGKTVVNLPLPAMRCRQVVTMRSDRPDIELAITRLTINDQPAPSPR